MGRLKLLRKAGGLRGPVPKEPFERCEIIIEKRPGQDWMDLHQAEINAGAMDRGELVPDDADLYVGANLYGFYVIPRDNVPPSLWPQGRTLLLTLQEWPFVDFRAECLADIERQKGPAKDVPETAEEHKAELADIGAKALAAHRAAGTPPGTIVPFETPARAPWWRRLFGKAA